MVNYTKGVMQDNGDIYEVIPTVATDTRVCGIEGCRDAYEVCADVDGDTSKIFKFNEDEYDNVIKF